MIGRSDSPLRFLDYGFTKGQIGAIPIHHPSSFQYYLHIAFFFFLTPS